MGTTLVCAQTFPSKPITLVVPFAAGGGTDSIARDVAKTLSERVKVPVLVDNKGGGGGSIGAAFVARAPADGQTLLFATSTFITNAALENKAAVDAPYNVLTDFAPIALLGRGPLLVVTSKSLGVKNLTQLRAMAQARGAGGLDFCSAGNGSINHLAGEWFKQKTKLEMTHVPYKGSGPATVDLLAGRVQLFFATVPTILPFVKDDRVDLLAVTGRTRSKLFPNTPTLIESGLEGFNLTTWWGVLAPPKTPKHIVDELNRAINAAAGNDLIKNRLAAEGADSFSGTPADFGKVLSTELSLWRGVVKAAGIKPI
jgi:tripartite-type tricarboxylate transporter receptor subunit TctC